MSIEAEKKTRNKYLSTFSDLILFVRNKTKHVVLFRLAVYHFISRAIKDMQTFMDSVAPDQLAMHDV